MLPEKRLTPFQPTPNASAIDDARRIDVRPRSPAGRIEEPASAPVPPAADEELVHFSCPGCLQMMAAPRSASSVQCPECSAWVMPPKLVQMGLTGAGKTVLPPPKKTGAHGMKR